MFKHIIYIHHFPKKSFRFRSIYTTYSIQAFCQNNKLGNTQKQQQSQQQLENNLENQIKLNVNECITSNKNNQDINLNNKQNILLEFSREFMKLIIRGLKKSWKDFRYLKRLSDKPKYEWNIQEIMEVQRIHKDQIKLIPFSFFIVTPFSGLLLPLYLLLLPNGIPNTFMIENRIKERKEDFIRFQEEAYPYLKLQLDVAFLELGVNPTTKNYDELTKAFLVNKDKLKEKLNINELDVDTLKYIAEFSMIEHIDGTNILNQAYRHIINSPRYIINLIMFAAKNPYRAKWDHPFFTHRFKLDFSPFDKLKKILLLVQIHKHLYNIQKQNQALKKFGLTNDDDNNNHLDYISRQRGIKIKNNQEIKTYLNNEWINHNLHILKNDPNLIFWYSVLQYRKCIRD